MSALSTEREFAVRQKRLACDKNLSLKIDNRLYKIINYNSFGIAVKSKADLPQKMAAEITLNDEVIFAVTAEKARRDHDLCAFKLVDCCIDLDVLNGHMLADKFIKPFKKMSVENMNTIEEAFDFASRLERQTKKTASLITKNLYGNNISLDVIKKQEDIIINKIGTLLGITFQLYFKRIFKLTEGMEAKEREDILNSFKKLRPYFFASKLLERAYTIPLGYHGDYHTINMIYSHDAFGATIYEKLVQHGGSSFQACMAVRNRAEYLTNKLRNALTVRDRKKSYKIISIASGPAYEIQKLIDTDTELMENVEISLLDAEIDSLEYAQRKLVEKCIQKSIHLKINYIKMDVLEIIKGKIREQYDFIYTAGLFDYFEDKVARTAGKILYNLLKKEGTLIIGNFSPNNMTKHFMTVISEWNLFYRDREKISQLFGDFSGNFDIEAEPEKINLFACIKREF